MRVFVMKEQTIMKFVKFAVLCAIALTLFATPRSAHAGSWGSDNGYQHDTGVKHGINAVIGMTYVSAFAIPISGFASVSDNCWIDYTWHGKGKSSALNVSVTGTVHADAPIGGSAGAVMSFCGILVGSSGIVEDETQSLPDGVLAGVNSAHFSTSLEADDSPSGTATASWSISY